MKRKNIIRAMVFFVALTAIFQSGCGKNSSQMENTSIEGSTIETSISEPQETVSDGVSAEQSVMSSSVSSDQASKEESNKDSSVKVSGPEISKTSEATNPSESSTIPETSKLAESSKQESSKHTETSKQESSKPAETSKQESSKPAETSKQESSKPAETSKQESSKPVEPSKPESSVAPAPVMAESVQLNVHSMTMTVGDKYQLSAEISPSNTDSKHLTWYWDDASVVSIDKNATISALGAGTTTITVKTDNGRQDTCKVTVKAKEQPKPPEHSEQESSKPVETSKPTETSKPSETSKQESSKPTDPILAAYTAPYDWDAVVADLRKVGEQQYGMNWEESLWVSNRGREYGSRFDDIYGFTWATDEKGNKYYQGNCQFCFPEPNTWNSTPEKFRDGCLYLFEDLERRLAKSDEYLEGTLFKIAVEDVGINDNGDQEYWVYLLYT